MTTLLERRYIEAQFAKAIYEELTTVLGEQEALEILATVTGNLAREQGTALALEDGEHDLLSFAQHIPKWTEGGALEIEEIETTRTAFHFDVVRCRYAEMYQDLGIQNLGAALSEVARFI